MLPRSQANAAADTDPPPHSPATSSDAGNPDAQPLLRQHFVGLPDRDGAYSAEAVNARHAQLNFRPNTNVYWSSLPPVVLNNHQHGLNKQQYPQHFEDPNLANHTANFPSSLDTRFTYYARDSRHQPNQPITHSRSAAGAPSVPANSHHQQRSHHSAPAALAGGTDSAQRASHSKRRPALDTDLRYENETAQAHTAGTSPPITAPLLGDGLATNSDYALPKRPRVSTQDQQVALDSPAQDGLTALAVHGNVMSPSAPPPQYMMPPQFADQVVFPGHLGHSFSPLHQLSPSPSHHFSPMVSNGHFDIDSTADTTGLHLGAGMYIGALAANSAGNSGGHNGNSVGRDSSNTTTNNNSNNRNSSNITSSASPSNIGHPAISKEPAYAQAEHSQGYSHPSPGQLYYHHGLDQHHQQNAFAQPGQHGFSGELSSFFSSRPSQQDLPYLTSPTGDFPFHWTGSQTVSPIAQSGHGMLTSSAPGSALTPPSSNSEFSREPMVNTERTPRAALGIPPGFSVPVQSRADLPPPPQLHSKVNRLPTSTNLVLESGATTQQDPGHASALERARAMPTLEASDWIIPENQRNVLHETARLLRHHDPSAPSHSESAMHVFTEYENLALLLCTITANKERNQFREISDWFNGQEPVPNRPVRDRSSLRKRLQKELTGDQLTKTWAATRFACAEHFVQRTRKLLSDLGYQINTAMDASLKLHLAQALKILELLMHRAMHEGQVLLTTPGFNSQV